MSEERATGSLPVALFAEVFALEQLTRTRVAQALPKGMELSQFTVLNHLAHVGGERTPAQLARAFSVTRGAMTNTLQRIERAGWAHVRPDWDDARRKQVTISAAGRTALAEATRGLAPILSEIVEDVGGAELRRALPVLRRLRARLSEDEPRRAGGQDGRRDVVT